MPIVTDVEHDNMKIEAELLVRKLYDEYKIKAQGDRLQGVRKEDGDKRQIQNGSADIYAGQTNPATDVEQYAFLRSEASRSEG